MDMVGSGRYHGWHMDVIMNGAKAGTVMPPCASLSAKPSTLLFRHRLSPQNTVPLCNSNPGDEREEQ